MHTYIVPTDAMTEGRDMPESIRAVQSIFKTQYDTTQSMLITKAFYEESNIMPLELHNQSHKKWSINNWLKEPRQICAASLASFTLQVSPA